MKRKFWYILFILMILAVSCKSVWLYHPISKIYATPEKIKLKYDEVFINTSDEVKLWAWWVPSVKNRGTVLFCHGNGGNISHRLIYIKIFNELGFNVFIFDYRGYAKSEGSPSEDGLYLDALGAWNYLLNERKIPADEIIVLGKSLGGPIASWLAMGHKPAVLILQSTFSSLSEVGKDHVSCLPYWSIIGDDYDTRTYLKSVKCPVLIIHSRQDETIPFHHGLALYKEAGEPKEFVEITGSHNQGIVKSRDIYKNGIDAFMKKYFDKRR